jgi:hypothetical protein
MAARGQVTVNSRGLCPACRFSQRLNSVGRIQHHHVYSGDIPRSCPGSYMLPVQPTKEGAGSSGE